MASLYKRPKSPFWYTAYFNSDGQRTYRSTGKRTKREALTVAVDWEREESRAKAAKAEIQPGLAAIVTREANTHSLTVDKARDYIKELYRISSGKEFKSYTVSQWIDHWLKAREPHLGQSSIARYHLSMKEVKCALGKKRDLHIDLLTTEDVLAVQIAISRNGGRATTINLKIQDFKSALKAAHEQGITERNVGTPVKSLPAADSKIGTAFEPEEIQTLISHAKPDWKGAIIIAAHTGLRLSNITQLDWRDVDVTKSEFTVKPVKQRKGNRAVIAVPMSASVKSYFDQRQTSRTGPVFPSLAGRKAAGHSSTFNNLMKASGIAKTIELPGGDTGTRSFHSLRHFYVTSMANADVPADVRQTLSAHKSADVHSLYTHHDRQTLDNAVATLPPLHILLDSKTGVR